MNYQKIYELIAKMEEELCKEIIELNLDAASEHLVHSYMVNSIYKLRKSIYEHALEERKVYEFTTKPSNP